MNELPKKAIYYVVVALVTAFILNLWVEYSDNAKKMYRWMVKPIFDADVPAFIPILFIIIIIVIFRSMLVKKDLNIAEVKKTLESSMNMLVMKNVELNSYRMRDILTHMS